MSCLACAQIEDCSEFAGGIISDTAPETGFYPLQDYSFLISCPSGYVCFAGTFPRVIFIPRGDIPEIIVGPGGTMSLLGCQSLLSVTPPPGTPFVLLVTFANSLFSQWASQEAECRAITTTVPAPVRISGHTRTDIGNTQQCFTASCGVEVCTPPGTFEITLFDATPDEIAATQARFNADALALATTNANAQCACTFLAPLVFDNPIDFIILPQAGANSPPNTGSGTETFPATNAVRFVGSATLTLPGQPVVYINACGNSPLTIPAGARSCRFSTNIRTVTGFSLYRIRITDSTFAVTYYDSGAVTNPPAGITTTVFNIPGGQTTFVPELTVQCGDSPGVSGSMDIEIDFGV